MAKEAAVEAKNVAGAITSMGIDEPDLISLIELGFTPDFSPSINITLEPGMHWPEETYEYNIFDPVFSNLSTSGVPH